MNSPPPLTPSAAGPIISVQKICKRFPGVVALEDVTLEILPGELTAFAEKTEPEKAR